MPLVSGDVGVSSGKAGRRVRASATCSGCRTPEAVLDIAESGTGDQQVRCRCDWFDLAIINAL